MSDSEVEDNNFVIPATYGQRNVSNKNSVRLTELGPRMTLQLAKIEKDLMGGDVIYHPFVTKSSEQAEADKQRVEERKRLKEERKRIQNENVKRKQELKSAKKKAKKERLEVKKKYLEDQLTGGATIEEDDDVEYYRQEVGEEPDPAMLQSKPTKRKYQNNKPMGWSRKRAKK